MSISIRTPTVLSSLDGLRRAARRRGARRPAPSAAQTSDPPSISLPYERRVGDPDNMPEKGIRVLGPYPNGVNFRLVIVEHGRRKSITTSTVDAAEALKRDIQSQIDARQTRTIANVLTEYIDHRVRDRGIVSLTVTELNRLTQDFLPANASITAITQAEATRLYDALTRRTTPRGTAMSPSTHHVMLRRTRAFFRFAVERGYIQQSPFERVKPIGRSSAGKTQLTIDEAKRFKTLALQRANDGDPAALGVLLLLMLGLRAGEVLARATRDVDDDARVLWIQRGKTKNARRRLEIPEELQEPLRRLIVSKSPQELIFGMNRKGGPRNRGYLWFKVQALCAAAAVPRVCSHSLRGLHSTLALEAGATPHLVAAALGHSSFRVTERHYAEPSSLHNSRARRVVGALGDTPASAHPPSAPSASASSESDMAALLSELSPEQRNRLRSLLHSEDPAKLKS